MQPDHISLSQALNQYLSSRPSKERPDIQQELTKFIRWSGRSRNVAAITPQEASEYGEVMAASAKEHDIAERLQAVKGFLSFCYTNNLTGISLAKHVKARKAGRNPISKKKARPALDITPEGYKHLQEELETLRQERVTVAQDIQLAAADKDFKENAPLDAARERQGLVEARIRDMEDSLQRARLVYADRSDAASPEERRVKLGSKVRLLDIGSGDEMEYTMVNASEANPIDYKMSMTAPVGKALLDRRVGEEVVVTTPRGELRYLIQVVEQ
jgi:transcription elongation factor GreA